MVTRRCRDHAQTQRRPYQCEYFDVSPVTLDGEWNTVFGYVTTSMHHPDSAITDRDVLRKVLDGSGGELASILRALAEISWNGVSLRTTLQHTQ